MAEYFENYIILSAEETKSFQEKLKKPSQTALECQRRTLDWVTKHVKMEKTNGGFCVTIPDEALYAEVKTSTDVYDCAVEEYFICSLYMNMFKKMSHAFDDWEVDFTSTFVSLETFYEKSQMHPDLDGFYLNVNANIKDGTDFLVEYHEDEFLEECA